MRAMSFNLRYNNPSDHGNLWTDRRHAVRSVLEESRPHLLGIQEGLSNQVSDLQHWLDGYMVVGRGREADLGGEHSCIFFRTDTFELLEHGCHVARLHGAGQGAHRLCSGFTVL